MVLICPWFTEFQVDNPYGCEDDVALATADNWVVSCPPTEDIVLRSPVLKTELPDLSPANKIGKCNNGYWLYAWMYNILKLPHCTYLKFESYKV